MAAVTALTTTVTIKLYFTNDVKELNERIGTTFPNKPSWVFEIEVDDVKTLKKLSAQYSNLIQAVGKNTKQQELVDTREGNPGQRQDVSPFLVFLISELGYTPDSNNPPPNTGNYKEGEVLRWVLTKYL